jgi:hypothetical protein
VGHDQSASTSPHQRQAGGLVGASISSGPEHLVHRAGVRHRSQARVEA